MAVFILDPKTKAFEVFEKSRNITLSQIFENFVTKCAKNKMELCEDALLLKH